MLSSSLQETQKLGANLARKLKGNEIVLLSGILGAGKTVFIRGLAKNLKVTSPITSPTFNIFRVYDCLIPESKTKAQLYHFDAYRLKKYADLLTIGWKDILAEENSIILLEWPECISDKDLAKIKNRKIIQVTIQLKNAKERLIEIL